MQQQSGSCSSPEPLERCKKPLLSSRPSVWPKSSAGQPGRERGDRCEGQWSSPDQQCQQPTAVGTRLLGEGLTLGSWHSVLSHLAGLSQGCFCRCHLLVRALARCRATLHRGDGSQAAQRRCGVGSSHGTSKTACLTCDIPGEGGMPTSKECRQCLMKACSTHLPACAYLQVCKVGFYSFGVESCADGSLIFCVLALDTCRARLVRRSQYQHSQTPAFGGFDATT